MPPQYLAYFSIITYVKVFNWNFSLSIHNMGLEFYPFPHIDTFWTLCSRRLLKTAWLKEKILKTSNFSIDHNFYNSIFNYPMFIYRDLPRRYQSRLLQIWCMWERVKTMKNDIDHGEQYFHLPLCFVEPFRSDASTCSCVWHSLNCVWSFYCQYCQQAMMFMYVSGYLLQPFNLCLIGFQSH